ncbi:hypothetical protein COCMIDRAFT_103928 [Bipolaris oryzae ATCC 44560]|uniref:Uncharacterized protein n=1 Tax=Bipolaris oryzae ATCC 44560 TaxID=930090 RepID=W6Z3U8_COCMI|nr:uncharacterized protein COCMIDRAFT_103928 [Bipolaris oryzae ATCC 44560]EUC42284.1 hypothetical protein COCMIDRAFT_103928 [Bipolaris oryzae ATCC 44560]
MTSPADLDLWHSYLRELKKIFEDNGTEDDLRVYAAPLTSIGISIGQSIDPQIVNHDLFRIGDLLLPAKNPVFMPGPSYSQRLLRYLQAAQVPPGRQDAASLKALNDANASLATQTDAFLACRRQAYALYKEDPEFDKFSFNEWVKECYPPYAQAQSSKDAVSQLAYQASQNYYGAQTDQLWNDKAKVSKAFSEVACPTYNMPTSIAQVTQAQVVGHASQLPINPADIKYEPRYTIDSTFMNIVTNWVQNAFNKHNEPFILKFRAGGTPNNIADGLRSGFMDVGFSNKITFDKDTVAPILPLFTASYDEKPVDENVPNLQAGVGRSTKSFATITIQASDAKVFAISPDQSWNIPDVASRYNLSPTAPPDLFEPLVLVSYALLGYMVSIKIQTDQALYNTIDQGLTKAQKLNGKATLFGLNVGAESSNSVVGFDEIARDGTQTFTIPPRDNSQLTLLGLMGKMLKTSPRSSSEPTK